MTGMAQEEDRAKPFLVLQLRPETEASDNEFEAILAKGDLEASQVHRIRLDQAALPGDLDLADYSGIIVGGGPGCVSDPPDARSPLEARIEEAVLGMMPAIVAADFPFLGCCYGIGILAHHLGAPVNKERFSEEVGVVECRVVAEGAADPLLAGLPERFEALVGHKEAVQALPPGCVHLLASAPCPFQMIRYGRNVYATQFHPEADGEVFEVRVRIYGDKGYFSPADATRIIDECRAADVRYPPEILRRFVERYRRA